MPECWTTDRGKRQSEIPTWCLRGKETPYLWGPLLWLSRRDDEILGYRWFFLLLIVSKYGFGDQPSYIKRRHSFPETLQLEFSFIWYTANFLNNLSRRLSSPLGMCKSKYYDEKNVVFAEWKLSSTITSAFNVDLIFNLFDPQFLLLQNDGVGLDHL